MSCGCDLQKQNLTAIFSAPQASAGSLSITKENFEKAMIIHTIRRVVKVNWINSSDQFCIPKNKLDKIFTLNCVIWSLFSSSNQTSAIDNIFYRDRYYKIDNHFYPFNYKEVYCNCKIFNYDNEKRFAYEYLERNKEYISKEALNLINISKELYKFFYTNINKINIKKFKISLWDSGFWQIRKSLKEEKLALNIYYDIKKNREILKNIILESIDNFIS